MKIELVIPGEPRGKGRPRIVRLKNGRSGSYTPDKTVSYEELIRQRFRQQWSSTELPFPDNYCENVGKTWPRQAYLRFHVARTERNTSGGVPRNDDGIPNALDRLECLGNAVVPQQFYPIFQVIRRVMQSKTLCTKF